ncbi:zinc finger protein 37-like [Ptychodera flava]|uniref:zinc finger protein 37-like n=1 Tax=Ptychodera flava TaxID=63121 RepID=UPI00396A634B
MEVLSSQGFNQSNSYAVMNNLLFQQFGFQVLANNIHEENTDTYPILVQSVLRESDVEIWGGFCVRAYIVILHFQKTPGQPEMCLAILLKNKYTPDVKRLGTPFKLQAYHLQWIQNVSDAVVDGIPVRNSKEIPFIAMYDAVELLETEGMKENLKPWKETEQTKSVISQGNSSEQDSVATEKMETTGSVSQSAARQESCDLSIAVTRDLKSWTDQSLEDGELSKTEGEMSASEEREPISTLNQSAVKEKSCDLSSERNQEVLINTVDMNNQFEVEGFQTDLKAGNEKKRIERTNEDALGDISREDGNIEKSINKSGNYDISEDFANDPSIASDLKSTEKETNAKDRNEIARNHSECQSKPNAVSPDILASTSETTEMPSTDTEGTSDTDGDESYHPEEESDSDEDFLPQTRSKKKRFAKKIATSRERKLQCEDCGKVFRVEKRLSLHMEWHKKKEENQKLKPERQVKSKERAGKKFYLCEDCSACFSEKQEYTRHMRKHQRDSVKRCIQCRFCGMKFEKDTELQEHVNTEHPGLKAYICEVCGACSKSYANLNKHSREMHIVGDFNCDKCDRVFKTRYRLKRHKNSEHPNISKNVYQCDICGYKSNAKYIHTRHQIVHTDERNFQCEVCGKGFKTNTLLKRHLNIHSGKKPYLCEVCGKGFGRKEHLKEHEVVHTKVNTFLCDYCGKNFSNKPNLYVHRRQHTGVRPVVCKICGKGFNRQRELAKHMQKIH